ncbi:MAG: ATP-binding protein [Nitrososphaerales archaeon]
MPQGKKMFDKLIEPLALSINPETMSSPDQQEQLLNLGFVVSRGDEGLDSPFFVEEAGEENVEQFRVNADIIATGRTCVIGASGSGKSYTVGVICEELCKNKVPFVIIDIEGEYSGLKERFEAIWVGDGEACDLRWKSLVDLRLLAKYAPDCPPIILDLSEADRPREKVSEFLISIYREVSRRRTPYLVILEEADRFSPQSGGERLPIFDEIARRGRKRGLGLLLCTQRPSLVDKNILSQCSNQLIGKLVIKNDLNSVAQFFSGRGPPTQLTGLASGEFFALGGFASQPEKVRVRARETKHGGITPKLNPTAVRASVGKLLEAIQTAMPLSAIEIRQKVAIEIPKKDQEEEQLVVSQHSAPKPIRPKYEIEKIPSTEQDIASDPEEEQNQKAPPFVIEDAPVDWDSGQKSTGILGLAPMIETESVPRLVKLEKSYKLFGQKENVTRVALAFRPLVEVGVRIRKGVLKKKFGTRYFFLDGVSGKLIEVTDRLGFRNGIERLLGLQEGQVVILKALYPDRDMSLIEVASSAKRLEDETRRLLKGLEAKRLVRSTRVGRANMYRRLTDIPKIDLTGQPLLKLNELNASDGFKLAKLKIKEDSVREVVKGMWDGADIESFRQIYYPVYLAELILNERKRYVWIDGRTGKEIEI